MIPEKLRKELVNQHYKIVGNHSLVKLCSWTKKSIVDKGFCYKQKFYPDFVRSHRCLQMSPSFLCDNSCLYCWRIIEKTQIESKQTDQPKEIIKEAIEAQRQLLSGFKGFEGTNLKKWNEAQTPTNTAISLVGEPTLYPKLMELIEEFHKMKIITFLVTNGLYPEVLEKISEPKQLYISLDSPDRETYKKLDKPSLPDFWERLKKSLEIMNSLSCRKVIRLTMVKEWNMKKPEYYAKLIEKANPEFIEVKAYMWVGESRKRLPEKAMPSHKEIQDFSKKISKESGYSYKDEQEASRVVLLSI